ncbi:hypothetical protein HII31_13025 [Pseudocercospora fuligena]|uniref:Uncharacterized protein n=1 Tax=Pseudocercospora fuligena TaxID=685502 RepID=A0A8H6VG26_9PEZI|nr:hypothetical protein HII31_13025 [Pseudocercospora fuligena]
MHTLPQDQEALRLERGLSRYLSVSFSSPPPHTTGNPYPPTMSSRTPKSRKAKKRDEYYNDPASEYEEDDEIEFVESDRDEFILAFTGLSVNTITEYRRFTWPKQEKARIVQHALVGRKCVSLGRSQIPSSILINLQPLYSSLSTNAIPAPATGPRPGIASGPRQASRQEMHNQVGRLHPMSPKCFPVLIEERKRGDDCPIHASKALISAESSDFLSWRAITSGEVAKDHADRGRTTCKLKNVNEMGKTELIKRTMDMLVRGNVITKDTCKSPQTPLNTDLSWLKSPSPGPAATSPMPPAAINKSRKAGYYSNFTTSNNKSEYSGGGYASDTDSDTELEPFPAKAKKQQSPGTSSKPPAKHKKSLLGDNDEVSGWKPGKTTSINKYLADDSDTEDEEQTKSKSESMAKEQLDGLLYMLWKQADGSSKKSSKQVDNSPTKLSANTAKTTPDKLRDDVMIAMLEQDLTD